MLQCRTYHMLNGQVQPVARRDRHEPKSHPPSTRAFDGGIGDLARVRPFRQRRTWRAIQAGAHRGIAPTSSLFATRTNHARALLVLKNGSPAERGIGFDV